MSLGVTVMFEMVMEVLDFGHGGSRLGKGTCKIG
jgi:hypothetical protein